MNLPIKLVDLVTLLFLSLMVVIIIFIILQRNIKRFKLRNVKEPHFLTCKSIPKDIKEAIIAKHSKSHAYRAPPQLLTFNHMKNSEDQTKSFLIRMKAFEASKNLEYALCDYGYRRPYSTKFEEFLTKLIDHNDEMLPTDLLKSYQTLYLWSMLDPMPFEMEQLRKHNFFINSIIEKLAFAKKSNMSEYNKILQHKLELNSLGDLDFRNQEMISQFSKKASIYENKILKDSFNINNNNNNPCSSNETSFMPNQFNKSSSKPSHKTPKSIFRKHSNSSSLKNDEDQDKEQLIIDTSFESTTNDNNKSAHNNKKQAASKSKKDNQEFSDQEENNTLKWSAKKNSKNFLESEKIPLVFAKKSHQKKKSNISEKINLEPLTRMSKASTSSNQLNIMNKINSATENEGFNQTFESNA